VEDTERSGFKKTRKADENVEKCGILLVQTFSQAYYVEILTKLSEIVRRKWPELWPNNWVLHNNCRALSQAVLRKKTCCTETSAIQQLWLPVNLGYFRK
jgi:hypothetical protein